MFANTFPWAFTAAGLEVNVGVEAGHIFPQYHNIENYNKRKASPQKLSVEKYLQLKCKMYIKLTLKCSMLIILQTNGSGRSPGKQNFGEQILNNS